MWSEGIIYHKSAVNAGSQTLRCHVSPYRAFRKMQEMLEKDIACVGRGQRERLEAAIKPHNEEMCSLSRSIY